MNKYILIVFMLLYSLVGSSNYLLANEINQNKKIESKNSVIENLYAGKDLKQFGYDTFQQFPAFAKDIKTGENYILSCGDKLNVYLWGNSIDLISIAGGKLLKSVNELEVDNDGHIFINGIGLIKVKGMSVKNAEIEIKNNLSQKFENVKVKITVLNPGSFPVRVYGSVKTPGTVFVDSNSNIVDAISLAGGILYTGSLRDIKVFSGKQEYNIDLYDLIIKGKKPEYTLSEGDLLLINPIGEVIAFDEGVKKTGIYEYKQGETLQDILNYTGGILPDVDGDYILLESFDKKINKQKINKKIRYSSIYKIFPQNGDYVSFKKFFNSPENYIRLSGNIKNAGDFEFKEGMKLSDILDNKECLLENSYLGSAIIKRKMGINKNIKLIPVNLEGFFNGNIDPVLNAGDEIEVFKTTKLQHIEISGAVENPGIIPFTPEKTLKSIIGIVKFSETLTPETEHYVNYEKKHIDINKLAVEITRQPIEEEDDEKNKESETIVVYLSDLLVKNNNDIKLMPNDKLFFRKLFPNELPAQIEVTGYVNKPGIYPVQESIKLSDAIKLAGGIATNGYLRGLILTREVLADEFHCNYSKANKNLDLTEEELTDKESPPINKSYFDTLLYKKLQNEPTRISLNIKTDNIENLSRFENIDLKAGDKIHVPLREKHVKVFGEVQNPAILSYEPKSNYKDYISYAGGVSRLADKGKIYLLKANGVAYSKNHLKYIEIEPGDTLIVPRKTHEPKYWLETGKSFMTIICNTVMSAFVLSKF